MLTELVVAAGVALATSPAPIDALDSVWVVSTPDAHQGTAFQLRDGLLLTAAHVVSGTTTVRLSIDGRGVGPTSVSAEVLLTDEALDVAVLSAPDLRKGGGIALSTTLPLAGDTVYAIGAPIDGLVLSRGQIVTSRNSGLIAASTPVDPGNSGGPLLRADGSAVGMVVEQADASGTAYAVPSAELRQVLLRAEGVPTSKPADPSTDPSTVANASSAFVPIALLIALLALAIAAITLLVVLLHRRRRPARLIITLDNEARFT